MMTVENRGMIVKRTEYHQMTSTFTYNIDEQEVLDHFGTVENFMAEMYDFTDQFYDFVADRNYDRENDVWTDRKGGYEIDWDIVDGE